MTIRIRFATSIAFLVVWSLATLAAPSPAAAQAADKNIERKADGKADAGTDDASERKKLLGTWRAVRMEFEGASPTNASVSNMWHFGEKEAVAWTEGQGIGEHFDGYTVDSRAKPMHLDMLSHAGGYEYIFPNIYEWSGEQLRIVMPGRGVNTKGAKKNLPRLLDRGRPKEFKTKPGDQSVWLLDLERVTEPVKIPKRPVEESK